MNIVNLKNGIQLLTGAIAYEGRTMATAMVRSAGEFEVIIVKSPRIAAGEGTQLDPPEIYLPTDSIIIRRKQ